MNLGSNSKFLGIAVKMILVPLKICRLGEKSYYHYRVRVIMSESVPQDPFVSDQLIRSDLKSIMIPQALYRSIRYRSLRESVIYPDVDTMKFNRDSSFARALNSYSTGKWQLPTGETAPTVAHFPTAIMRHLRILQTECQKIGAKLVLATVLTNSYNPNYRALVGAVGMQLDASFIQGNDTTTDFSDFSDGVQLNSSGATLLSRFIGLELKSFTQK